MKRKRDKRIWSSLTGIWTLDFWTSSRPWFEFWGRLDQSSSWFLKNLDFTMTLTKYKETHWFCRCGICGAWSYDETEELCYMHTADGCCGQKEKQVQKSNWISGYFCIHCWSTKNQCPCSLKDRLQGQIGCKIAQNSGATNPQYNNPTVSPNVASLYVQTLSLIIPSQS